MAQSSTQTLGGRYGRMLSSSLLVLGTQQQQSWQQHQQADDDDDTLILLWRIDPTGQFWKVNASGIGRGGTCAELEFIRRVRRWKRGVQRRQQQLQLQQPQQ